MAIIFAACWGALGSFRGSFRLQSEFELFLVCVWGLNAFFKHWVTSQACVAFAADRDKGAMELLLSTSLDVREMLHGHALALRRQFFAPVLLVGLLELAIVATAGLAPDAMLWPLLSLVVFAVDLYCWRWLGWWMGAASKSFSRALAATYFRVLVIPTLLFLALLTACHLTEMPSRTTEGIAMVAYLLLSVCVDVIYARWARRRLLSELRTVASERSGGERRRWWNGRGWPRLMGGGRTSRHAPNS
jgi:hypothetical protein